jgi:hypothetical protein
VTGVAVGVVVMAISPLVSERSLATVPTVSVVTPVTPVTSVSIAESVMVIAKRCHHLIGVVSFSSAQKTAVVAAVHHRCHSLTLKKTVTTLLMTAPTVP